MTGVRLTMRHHAWFLALLLLTICACSGKLERSRYKEDLLAQINSADRIVVTEHSDESDAGFDENSRQWRLKSEIVYRTRILSQLQTQRLRTVITGMDPAPKNFDLACTTEVHHSIIFYGQGKQLSKMDICFACGHVLWPGSRATLPLSLITTLDAFMRDIGLEPKRDWYALALPHLPPQAASLNAPAEPGKPRP